MSTDQATAPQIADILQLVEAMIHNRDEVINALDAEIQLTQLRFTVLSAIRDSLVGEESIEEASEEVAADEETELPLADQDEDQQVPIPSGASGKELESQIAKYIEQNGPAFPGEIAKALDVSAIKVGRTVAVSKRLAKESPDRHSSRIIRVSRV